MLKIKIDITNIVTGRKWGTCFYNENIGGVMQSDAEVQSRMDSWIAQMESKALRGVGWGWAARDIPKTEMEDKYLPILIEEYEKPSESGGTETWCKLDKEYTIVTEDLTAEFEAELAEIEADKVTCEQIKQAISIIDGWNSTADININFLKKFFKYLIRKTI